MHRPHVPPPSVPHASALVPLLAAGVTLLQVLPGAGYGIFRDEFYYLACADRLAWGYVDHPPLSIAILAAWKEIAGVGMPALRIPGAMLNGAAAILAALLARELGGWRMAQVLAAIAVGLMPGVLAVSGFYSMNSYDVVFWLTAALIAARLLRGGPPRLWILLGAVIGLGLLNKYSVALLPVGLAAGCLLPPRRRLRGPEPWIGAAVALALVLPHLVWQMRNGWPTLEFMANARAHKMADLSVADFWREAALLLHPLSAPLALLGLAALLAGRRLRAFRPLGVAVALSVFVVFLGGGKPYYLTAAWPLALAAGGVAFERWIYRYGRAARRAGGGTYAALLIAGGLAIAPLAIPLLPVERFLEYQRRLGVQPSSGENNPLGALPQHFADRFGWQPLARSVFGVVVGLPDEDRASCLILAGNYGEAAALRYFGARRQLAPVVSGHNNFHLWGLPAGAPWRVVVAVGIDEEDLRAVFETVEVATVHKDALAMPYESDLPVHVCRGWRVAPQEAWARAKRFI